MIIDDAIQTVRQLKQAMASGRTRVEAPPADMDFSTKLGQENDAARALEAARTLKDSFLSTLTEPQRKLWEEYQAAYKHNVRIGDKSNVLYDEEKEQHTLKSFRESLSPQQEALYTEARKSKRAWRTLEDDSERTLLLEMLGKPPSSELTLAKVSFPKNLPKNKRYAIYKLLTGLNKFMDPGVILGPIRFHPEYTDKEELIGMSLKAEPVVESFKGEYLDFCERALVKLSGFYSSPELWEKIRTNRGDGYRYKAIEKLGDVDPFLQATHILATEHPTFGKDAKVFYKLGDGREVNWSELSNLRAAARSKKKDKIPKAEAVYLVLTGEAAGAILEGELGINLREIRPAEPDKKR